jgi:hypothetical protein
MPVIREYENPINGLQIDDSGASNVARAAEYAQRTQEDIGGRFAQGINRLGGVLQKMQDKADKAKAQKEIITGIATLSTIEDNLNTEWDQIAKSTDPNNLDQVRAAFLDKAQQQLSAVSEGMTTPEGQMWAAEHAASVGSTFHRTTAADSANAAFYATHENLNVAANTQAESVRMHPDTADDKIAQVDSSVDAVLQSSNVDAANSAKEHAQMASQWKKAIAVAAIQGQIDKQIAAKDGDPATVAQDIALGKYDKWAPFLGEDGLKSMQDEAMQASRAKNAQDNATDAEKLRVENEHSKQAAAAVVLKAYDPATGKINIEDNFITEVMKHQAELGIKNDDMVSTVAALERLKAGGATEKTTDGLVNDIVKRSQLPMDDPNRPTTAEINGYVGNNAPGGKTLTNADYDFVNKFVNPTTAEDKQTGALYTDSIQTADAIVNPPKPIDYNDPVGLARGAYRQRTMELAARQAFIAGTKANTPGLLDPNSPNYIFSNKFLNFYSTLEPPTGGQLPVPVAPAATTNTVAPPLSDDDAAKRVQEILKGQSSIAPDATVQNASLEVGPTVNRSQEAVANISGGPDERSVGGATHVVAAGKGFTKVALSDGTVINRRGVRNWRNNNPGNIEYGKFARGAGAIGTDGRFAVFATLEAGRKAQEHLLFEVPRYANKTISAAIAQWAPPSENDTGAYTASVASAVGVDSSTKMGDLTKAQRQVFLAAMQKVEGFKQGSETVEA